MAQLVELHDHTVLVNGLQDDLNNANDRLQRVTHENTRLLSIIEDLKTELRVARTVAAIHIEDDVLDVTFGPTPSASNVVMVPITMQLAAVANGGQTKEHIFERMDVDTCPGMDIPEIPANYYKTKWYISNREPLDQTGWIFPSQILKQLPGFKKLDEIGLMGKNLRCFGNNATDASGKSIAGFFVLGDFAYALFFEDVTNARRWSKNINNANNIIAPSLTSIATGSKSIGTLYAASYKDILKIIARHQKMADFRFDIANAYAECERGTTDVDDILAKCEIVSVLVYNQSKIDFQRRCEEHKAVYHSHDASAPCVICKEKNCDFGYEKHCFDCYVKQFPTIRFEILVRGAIDATFEGFIHNKVMPSSGLGKQCERQIDHRLQIGNTILAIETDEHAHKKRNKCDEIRRYNEFTSSFPHKFVFIRFNPHANMEDPYSKTNFKHKLGVLIRSITYHMHRIRVGLNVNKLETWTLFYC